MPLAESLLEKRLKVLQDSALEGLLKTTSFNGISCTSPMTVISMALS